MNIVPTLTRLSCILLILLSSGCSTLLPSRHGQSTLPARTGRLPGSRRTPAPTSPLRTEFLMLNIAEASGWVAFADSDTSEEDTEDYRIIIQRESTGEVLFESSIPLARGLRTHGFEMSRSDARLLNIASTVDAGILPPLRQLHPDRSDIAETLPSSDPSPASEVIPDSDISVMTGVHVIDALENALILQLDNPDDFAVGHRIFLRTPPETLQDAETGDVVILSRGRIAGLLEITELIDDRATATLLSGEIPSEGYLERVLPNNL